MKPHPSGDDLRLEEARQVDTLCDHFEAAWLAGRPTRIEEVLAAAPAALRPALARELVTVDVQLRQRCGETPTAAEYEARLPEYVAAVREVFS